MEENITIKEKEYLDSAKAWFLIGLQADEVASALGKPLDLERAWGIMTSKSRVDFLASNRDLFLGVVFEERKVEESKS